jgi:hypothetical protein
MAVRYFYIANVHTRSPAVNRILIGAIARIPTVDLNYVFYNLEDGSEMFYIPDPER